jgi:small subunit ribosomal protein S6
LATSEYELILMLDPQLGDEQREALAADAKSRIEANGTIGSEATWGLRRMAYEIQRHAEADYRYYRFNGGKELLDDLNHALRIADGVLRFRIFKVGPESPVIVPPDTEQVMRRDEEDDRGRGRGGRRDDRGPRRSQGGEDESPASQPVASGEASGGS